MFNFIQKLFGSPSLLKETDSMKKFLIVGLGNIGSDYNETRHNIGFKVLDFLAEQEAFTFESAKLGSVGTFKHKGKSVLCLKPSTYMNLSGKAVKYWMDQENIPMDNLLIITDDINLPFGTIRLKTKGSDGGHNGLKDVQNMLQTTHYNRFRFGVGADFGKGRQVDYVLGKWNAEENKAMTDRLIVAADLVRSFVFAGVKNTMNQFNGK
ncbi:aminoacyl-tRNA hydrolase [Flagellimonas aequoris]|uniref:Peptidyl-tRNA hydrolase n=1 Tax=Flagellimonas aequoris TaxID=2306997 RepID=A0A418NB37_9FLAO|nr:aminoacyl-tRNA hydrolase [Allomuricauda aequoris]RIV73144.1 aminoacyl-tRNA hydrolase [Allomuricauda aequoris]TXK06950.1 aminoacyl-tRNA hydrolase [Allomuricauda aequoris]